MENNADRLLVYNSIEKVVLQRFFTDNFSKSAKSALARSMRWHILFFLLPSLLSKCRPRFILDLLHQPFLVVYRSVTPRRPITKKFNCGVIRYATIVLRNRWACWRWFARALAILTPFT